MNAFYSTPDCYAYAINRERPAGWSLKTDDVLPYASDPSAFWSGYFTSRAALKGYERAANAFLQVRAAIAARSVRSGESSGASERSLFT